LVTTSTDDESTLITLLPNRSASWGQTRVLLVLLGAFVLLVGLAWSLAGAWVILPFAGLEVLLLVYFLHKVSYQTYRKELIRIERDRVTVSRGVYYPQHQWQLQRPGTYLAVTRPHRPLEELRLSLADDHARCEIGMFLNQQDREQARALLLAAGLPEVSNRWWESTR